MDHHGPAFGSLVIVAILAFVVPLLLNRLKSVRIPIAAGEILVGILVGKSGLGLVQPDSLLEILNFLGLSALMFLAGMEIDLGALLGRAGGLKGRPAWLTRLHNPLAIGLVIFLLSAAGAYYFSLGLHSRGLVQEPLFLTLIITTCGLSIILPVLKDRQILNAPLGQVILSSAVIGDFLPLLGLSVLAAIKVKGSAADALWLLVLIIAAGAFYVGGRFLMRFRLTEGLSGGTAQIGVRASFALMLIFLALAESIGVKAILGAFLAGFVLATLAGHERETITHKLDALGFGFLIPVFFIMVGVTFDLPALLADRDALLLVPLLFGGTVLVHALPVAILALWHPLRHTLGAMALMTTQMSVTIAASTIAFGVGAYGASTHAAIILVAIMTAILGPVTFNRIVGDSLTAGEQRRGILLAGMNRLSLLLGRRLSAQGYPVFAVDQHEDRVKEFMAAGIHARLGDPATAEGLRQANAEEAACLIAITQDEAANLRAATAGHAQFQIPRAILFASDTKITQQAEDAGFVTINPDLAGVALVENMVNSAGSSALLTGTDEDVQLADFLLTGGPLSGQPLRSVTLPPQVLVASIRRGHEKIVPHGNTVLHTGDLLTVVGPATAWEAMRQLTSPGVATEADR